MIDTAQAPAVADVARRTTAVFETAKRSTDLIRRAWDPEKGTPVFTVDGTYTTRGWTEWTQGFQFGNAIYLFDATGDRAMLDYGRTQTVREMATHVSHTGVHDHGFNNVSTYGNLLRLMVEGTIEFNQWEAEFYRLALKTSAAAQGARWTALPGGLGYIHSFNGAHSLFSDTVRTLRVLALGHQLGHVLMAEQDEAVSLLTRLIQHAETTARYNVYYGTGRDTYDRRGRVVHESIFNTRNGAYRCPSTQQGYTPFSTWTRGHAWVLTGFAEELEWLNTRESSEIEAHLPEVAPAAGKLFESATTLEARLLEAACATADFYIDQTPTDGVPYWDTGAPGLAQMEDYTHRAADPFNGHEPVDSSAGAISAQGLLRLGRYLATHAARLESERLMDRSDAIADLGQRYVAAGLITANTLFDEPYLNRDPRHQGILLHSVYHRPNGWDRAPDADGVPRGESCMWGDYHLLELAVYLQRLAILEAAGAADSGTSSGKPYLTFFGIEL